jgi:hypothetical protein
MNTHKSRQVSMTAIDDSAFGDDARRVIPFRPRTDASANRPTQDFASPVADLTEFERAQGGDNYRHRMLVNGAALAFTVVLMAAGVWIAESMAALRKSQDCVLTGRRSCPPVAGVSMNLLPPPTASDQRR